MEEHEKLVRYVLSNPNERNRYCAKFFSMVDTDGNGTLSMLEFVNFIKDCSEEFFRGYTKNSLDYFKKIDADNSGGIDIDELTSHITKQKDLGLLTVIVRVVNDDPSFFPASVPDNYVLEVEKKAISNELGARSKKHIATRKMSLKILGENVMKQTKVVKHWQKQLESSWSGALDYHHSFKLREEVETLYTRRAELHQLGEENLHANPPRHAAALKCYQESLMICIDLFGPKHFNCLADAIMLAQIYTDLNDGGNAKLMLDVCFGIQSSEQAHPHATVGVELCIRVGHMYIKNGSMQEAQRCFVQSTKIADDRFGKWDPRTAATYQDVSGCFITLGDPEMALHFEGKALVIKTAHYGVYHDETCQAQTNVAVLYRLLKRYEQSLNEFMNVRKVYEEMYGRNSLEVAGANISIGFTHHTMNHILLAEKCYKDAFRVRLAILGEDHTKTNEARELLDEVCVRIGSYSGTEEESKGSSAIISGLKRSNQRTEKQGKRYTVNELMRAISEVGERTYVPNPLRKKLLEACDLNTYLTAFDVKNFAPAESTLDKCICNYIAGELQKDQHDAIGKILAGVGGESFQAGTGYGIISGGDHQGPDAVIDSTITVYYSVVAETMNRLNEEALTLGIPSSINAQLLSKVESVMAANDGSMALSKLETSLLAGNGSYQRVGIAKLMRSLRENIPAALNNMHRSGVPKGYGMGGGEITVSAEVLKQKIIEINYLKENPVIDDETASTIVNVANQNGGNISVGALFDKIAEIEPNVMSSFDSAFKSSVAKDFQAAANVARKTRRGTVLATRPMQRPRGGVNSSERGRSGTTNTNERTRSATTVSKEQATGTNIRSKLVPLSGSELWEMFGTKLLTIGRVFQHLRSARKRRQSMKLLAIGMMPGQIRKRIQNRLTKKVALISFPLGLFAYLRDGPTRRITCEQKSFSGLPKSLSSSKGANKTTGKKKISKFKQVQFGANDKVTSAEGTMWAAQGGRRDSFVNFVSGDLETMFAKAKNNPAKKITKKDKKKTKADILPQKENQNISMAVYKITKKCTFEDLVMHLNNLNASAIGSECLEILKKLVEPINQFQNQVLAWRPEGKPRSYEITERDKKMFSPAEELIWNLSQVAQLPLRINVLHFLASYKDILQPLADNCTVLAASSNAVLESKRLPKVLEYILVLANYLNDGGNDENLAGIKLSGLSRITQTKSNSGVNLLEFLVTKLQTKNPDLLLLKEDFQEIKSATTLSNATMNVERKQLQTGLKNLQNAISSGNKRNEHIWDEELGPFADKAEISIERVENTFREAEVRFKEACKYMAETKVPPFEIFFSMLLSFLDSFHATTVKMKEKAEKEAAAKVRAEKNFKKQEGRAMKKEADTRKKGEGQTLTSFTHGNSSRDIANDADSTGNAILASVAHRRRNLRASVTEESVVLRRNSSKRKVLRVSPTDDNMEEGIPPPTTINFSDAKRHTRKSISLKQNSSSILTNTGIRDEDDIPPPPATPLPPPPPPQELGMHQT